MEVRGFDSYDISLGDEMRGERASLGKSLEDVERDLKIKVKMLTAIENCDLTGFTNQSVIAGYVRSYAKYLGMNVDDCYARFCAESGYRSPAAIMAASGGLGPSRPDTPMGRSGSQIADSRFAAPPSRNRFQARISFGAITSALALIALIAGLSYGGYALLQDIQRVGFAPLPEAPTVVADAPRIDEPVAGAPNSDKRPDASAYAGGGALAATVAPSDISPGPRPRRDGPISAIDPRHASLFTRTAPDAPTGNAFADASTDLTIRTARTEFGAGETPRATVATAPVGGINTDAAPTIARLDTDPTVDLLTEGPILPRRDTIPRARPTRDASPITPSVDPITADATPTAPEVETADTATPVTPTTTVAERGIVILATGETWVEVRDRNDAILISRTMQAGQEVKVPDTALAPKIHTGNAGDTYVIVDGVAYGPLGPKVQVNKRALTANKIRAELPQRDVLALRSGKESEVIKVAPVAEVDPNMVLPPKRPKR